jgi:hypothetical protein
MRCNAKLIRATYLSTQNNTPRVELPTTEAGEEENPLAVIAQSIAVFAKANETNIANADLSIWAATIEAFVDACEPQSSRASRAVATAEAAVADAEAAVAAAEAAVAAAESACDMRVGVETQTQVPVTLPTEEQAADLARIRIEIELMRDFELAVQQELDAERNSKMEAILDAAKSEFPDNGVTDIGDAEDADTHSVVAVPSATLSDDADELINNAPSEGLTVPSEYQVNNCY